MKEATPALPAPPSPFAGSEWFDPLEEAVRGRVRSFIEELLASLVEGSGDFEGGEGPGEVLLDWKAHSVGSATSGVRSRTVAATGTGRAS